MVPRHILTTLVASAFLLAPHVGHGAPPAPAKPVRLQVDASKAAAALNLASGQRVVVSATGSWQVDGKGLYGRFDANGTTTGKPTEACALVPTARMGSLVATLDGSKTWFAVGAKGTVRGPGPLQFAANDCTGGPGWPHFGDNSGTVTITLSPSAPVADRK